MRRLRGKFVAMFMSAVLCQLIFISNLETSLAHSSGNNNNNNNNNRNNNNNNYKPDEDLTFVPIYEKNEGRDPLSSSSSRNMNDNEGTFIQKLLEMKTYYEDALQIKRIQSSSSDKSTELCPILMALGDIQSDLGSHDEAMKCYMEALSIRQKESDGDDGDVASNYNSIGVLYWLKGEYQEALKNLQQALRIREEIEDEQGLPMTLTNLGNVYNALGRFEESISSHEKALQTQRFNLKDNEDLKENPHFLLNMSQVLQNFGSSLMSLGRFDEATQMFEESLEIRSSLESESFNAEDFDKSNNKDVAYNPAIASLYLSMGGVFGKRGMHEKELEFYEKALDMFTNSMGTNHSSVGSALANIGNALAQLGQNDEALDRFRRALKIKRDIYGCDHPSCADVQNSIGNVYLASGDLDLAYDAYKDAMRIRSETFGDKHPSVYSALGNLGCVVGQRGDTSSALSIFSETLVALKSALGSDHISVANTLCNIGTIHMHLDNRGAALEYFKDSLEIIEKCGKDGIDLISAIGQIYDMEKSYDEALKFYNMALDKQCMIYGPDNPNICQTLNRIGPCSVKNLFDKALQTFNKALRLQRDHLGNDHTMNGMTLHNFGNVNSQLGNYDEALKSFAEAVQIFKRNLGSDAANVGMTLFCNGNVKSVTGKYNEALVDYREALRIAKLNLGEEHPECAMILHNMASVYGSMGDFDLAAQKYSTAKDIRIKVFGPSDESVAETTSKLAMVHYMNRDMDGAVSACNDVLSFKELGKNHIIKADAQCVLGYVQNFEGNVKKAIKSHKEALRIYRANKLDDDHPKVEAMIKSIRTMRENKGY